MAESVPVLSTMCPTHQNAANLHGVRRCMYCMQMQKNSRVLQRNFESEAAEAHITQVCIIFTISFH